MISQGFGLIALWDILCRLLLNMIYFIAEVEK